MGRRSPIKFLCPAPGYDRHFAITESLGIEMIAVPMRPDGPDVAAFPNWWLRSAIKGMWAVPKYSNPTGAVYSEEVVRALVVDADRGARLPPVLGQRVRRAPADRGAARSDRHSRSGRGGRSPQPRYVFASTSKITFAGAGVSFFGASARTWTGISGHAGVKSIGPDKINQLRHLRFFGDADGVRAHMAKHREMLAPKFALVLEIFEDRLGASKVASWTEPEGGYFISLDVVDGTAERVIELAKEAGIALTAAGSAFPYKSDPDDRNIRLAPTFPGIEELRSAMNGVATCVLLAAADKLLAEQI